MAPKSRTDKKVFTRKYYTRTTTVVFEKNKFSNKWCDNIESQHLLNSKGECKTCERNKLKNEARLEAIRLEKSRLEAEEAEFAFQELLDVTNSEMEANNNSYVSYDELEELMGF